MGGSNSMHCLPINSSIESNSRKKQLPQTKQMTGTESCSKKKDLKEAKELNSRGAVVEHGTNNEEFKCEVRPCGMIVQKRDSDGKNDDHGVGVGVSTRKIKVSHGSNQHDLTVAPESTCGDLKRFIASETGLEPEEQTLLFRGKEKEDQEYLHMAGMKGDAKVLLIEDSACKERKLEEVKGSTVISIGCEAVAEIRAKNDELSEKVSALKTVVGGGTKVAEKDIVCLTEMLMRQLLKLDSINAEGEGKVQRKMEVRRVQSLEETVDNLKARNSNLTSNSSDAVSVTTQGEKSESDVGGLNAPPSMPFSTKVTQDWELFD